MVRHQERLVYIRDTIKNDKRARKKKLRMKEWYDWEDNEKRKLEEERKRRPPRRHMMDRMHPGRMHRMEMMGEYGDYGDYGDEEEVPSNRDAVASNTSGAD